jgi:hypothetical protein
MTHHPIRSAFIITLPDSQELRLPLDVIWAAICCHLQPNYFAVIHIRSITIMSDSFINSEAHNSRCIPDSASWHIMHYIVHMSTAASSMWSHCYKLSSATNKRAPVTDIQMQSTVQPHPRDATRRCYDHALHRLAYRTELCLNVNNNRRSREATRIDHQHRTSRILSASRLTNSRHVDTVIISLIIIFVPRRSTIRVTEQGQNPSFVQLYKRI